MRAFFYELDNNGNEQLPGNITCEYRTERNLVRYGIPANGRYRVHIHRNFDKTLYKKADKVIQVNNGQST